MKQFRILRDKPIAILFSAYVIAFLIRTTLLTLRATRDMDASLSMDYVVGFFRWFSIIIDSVIVFAYIKIMSRVMNFVYIDDQSIMKGLVFPQRIKLFNVNSIKIKDRVEIRGENKTMRLIKHASPRNIEAYRDIFEMLEQCIPFENTQAETLIEEISDKNTLAKKWDGLLTLILCQFVLELINTKIGLSSIVKTVGGHGIAATITTLSYGILMFQIIVIILMIIKNKRAPLLILVSQGVYLAVVIISNMFWVRLEYDILFISIVFIDATMVTLYTLVLRRYLRESKTVKQIFSK